MNYSANKEEIISLTQQLIACGSITPADNGCQDIIRDFLAKLNFKIIDLSKNGTTNTLAILKSPGEQTFAFAGHTDVVPVGDTNKWRYPPFSGQIADGLLYGRGSADMKGSLAAMLIAVKAFLANNPNPAFSISFLITSDEEGDATYGTPEIIKYLKSNPKLIPDFCLVGEPSSEKQLGDTVKIGRRGSITADITVIGKQGHVAYPDLALNPIPAAIKAFNSIAALKLDNGNADFPPSSLQFTNINSGTGANNVIPHDIKGQFNIRYSPLADIDEVKNTVKNILDEIKLPYKLTWRHTAKPFITDRKKEFVKKAAAIIESITGIAPKLTTTGGTSDARFIAPLGTQVIEFGPINKTIHSVNEYVKVGDLVKLSESYYSILTSL